MRMIKIIIYCLFSFFINQGIAETLRTDTGTQQNTNSKSSTPGIDTMLQINTLQKKFKHLIIYGMKPSEVSDKRVILL